MPCHRSNLWHTSMARSLHYMNVIAKSVPIGTSNPPSQIHVFVVQTISDTILPAPRDSLKPQRLYHRCVMQHPGTDTWYTPPCQPLPRSPCACAPIQDHPAAAVRPAPARPSRITPLPRSARRLCAYPGSPHCRARQTERRNSRRALPRGHTANSTTTTAGGRPCRVPVHQERYEPLSGQRRGHGCGIMDTSGWRDGYFLHTLNPASVYLKIHLVEL